MDTISKDYWSQRYTENNTPWDIGYPSIPLMGYLQNLVNKDAKILIPGAGNAYEAEWLWRSGFKNTFVIDLAEAPLKNLQNRVPDFPSSQLVLGDFFDLDQTFDLIIEQTFFCALNPSMRVAYAAKMASLLKREGHLVGLLFDFELTETGPPFGGSIKEYKNLFAQYFKVHKLERCYNSIKPRQGNELFIHLINPIK